jgi:acyl-CoA dehydrogenase
MVAIPTETVGLSASQRAVREAIESICAPYDDAYWQACDAEARYPQAFVDDLAAAGWLGILVPERYGGLGMGTAETVVMLETIARSGGFAGAQAVHGGIYNSVPIVEYASEAIKERLLPAIAAGSTTIQAFGLTEAGPGSDSTSIETTARRDGEEYVVDGQKRWTSRLDVSDYMLLMTRTTPKADAEKRTRGITMFLVEVAPAIERGAIEMTRMPKSASRAVHSYELDIEGLRVPADQLIGERGEGFYQVLGGLNEERLVIAAECVGLGELAIDRGVRYAQEREVFDAPIGANQSIQHPLAAAYARVQAAKALTHNAARADAADRQQAGANANMAKYLASEAAFAAADAAVQTHGGLGISPDHHVERYLREARLTRLVPITQQLILNYLGEKVLGLARSY